VVESVLQEILWVSPEEDTALAPKGGSGQLPAERGLTPPTRRPIGWRADAVLCVAAAAGLALFLLSLRGVDLASMNGLGLLSALPLGAVAGVIVVALAFMFGLTLPRAHVAGLAVLLAALVVCLDGITAFIEPAPRFPTTYQILGFVDYVSTTGHTAPSLAAYFSWPGFFGLISLVTGAAGIHSILTLLRIWPMIIDLLYLPPLFLIMRNLRFTWRAQWLAAFFFTVGNWVGQDYFSPQSFAYLLYLVFVAILVNWFVDPDRTWSLRVIRESRLAALHRRVFGDLRPGERPSRPATTGQRAFFLGLLIAIFTVSTVSHQLTPLFMLAACGGLVLVRRCTAVGLPILLGVIFAGYTSFAAVGYWSGHLSDVFGGIGDLGFNVSTSVSGRLAGTSSTHLLALHAKVALGAVILGLAAIGLLRRRRRGMDDRVLLVLVVVPIALIGVVSYGGEIALRTYLFMLPPASLLAAAAFFPSAHSVRPRLFSRVVLAGCALVLPVSFFLARYANEAYEQVPQGELAATNWVYAHDAHGVRLLWLSTAPEIDVTPQMPWAYRDLTKVAYVPALAPRDPARVNDLVSTLRRAGPGSYLIATQTQVAAMQQTADYSSGWGQRFERTMAATRGVRVVFSTGSAVVYTLRWPSDASRQPLGPGPVSATAHPFSWTESGLIALWVLLAMMAMIEFIRLWHPSARLRLIWIASAPLFLLLLSDIALRFVVLS
jgi:hypothetical protein